MSLSKPTYVFIFLIVLVAIRVAFFDFVTSEIYRPDNWAGMSFTVGAAILTLVGIITSIVVSNENERRGEFVEKLNFVMDKLKEKARVNPDRSFAGIYENSEQKLKAAIDERSPIGYSDGIIGLVSFFCFLISAIFALEGVNFKWIYYFFLSGIALLVGYVVYLITQFVKIDGLSRLPKKKGSLSLLSIRINGQPLPFNQDSREPIITVSNVIRRMEFGLRFVGQVRNGFFHATIRFTNGYSTYVPEPNTYLGDTVFAEGRILVISPDRRLDTGILQNNKAAEVVFEVCKDITENPQIGEVEISRLGKQGIHRYCSIPEDYNVESIELRVYEDPLFRSNYKRREIDLIKVSLERSAQT